LGSDKKARPLQDEWRCPVEFTTAGRNWGFQLRFGLFEISEHDMAVIAAAMGAAALAGSENL
jgi:hypothetical protein